MLQKFTVIGEYWDNEQGFATQVEAVDADGAIELAEAEVKAIMTAKRGGQAAPVAGEAQEDEEEDNESDLLRVWAVLQGWPEVLYLRDAA